MFFATYDTLKQNSPLPPSLAPATHLVSASIAEVVRTRFLFSLPLIPHKIGTLIYTSSISRLHVLFVFQLKLSRVVHRLQCMDQMQQVPLQLHVMFLLMTVYEVSTVVLGQLSFGRWEASYISFLYHSRALLFCRRFLLHPSSFLYTNFSNQPWAKTYTEGNYKLMKQLLVVVWQVV